MNIKFNNIGNLVKEFNVEGIGGKSILINKNQDIILGGYFSGTVDFDNSDSIHKLSSFNNNINGFVLKLNSDFGFIWVKSIGDSYTEIQDIVIDNDNNLFCLSNHQFKISISKINSSGEFNFQKYIVGSTLTQSESIAIFQNKYLYVTGLFNNTIDFFEHHNSLFVFFTNEKNKNTKKSGENIKSRTLKSH